MTAESTRLRADDTAQFRSEAPPFKAGSFTGRALSSAPFYIRDPEALREKLAKAERDGTRMGQVWASVRRRVQAAPPGSFPWFTPFVALVTREPRDIEAARQVIRDYVGTFDQTPYNMGLQFHFWCYALPHARWALYFQWLHSLNAWDPKEAERLGEELIAYQFVNFFYGMRTKPEPECVDNQTMSLCFSNALFGQLFPDSVLARRMARDGARRLPDMLGGFPPSGYSGEGSTYMDHVVGPCVPYVVELLERIQGGDWFSRRLGPCGGSAEAVVRMIAREWMPSGLTLPWDHYGYSLPTRSCIAYGAHRTGDPVYTELLERHAGWTHDVGVGWGYDDIVWSLIWWPERSRSMPPHPDPLPRGERESGACIASPLEGEVGAACTAPGEGMSSRTVPAKASVYKSWSEPTVGAALVSQDARLYLMQMWDPSTPGDPGRAHVNPNAVVLDAFGGPLTTDGVPNRECKAFEYEDTWKEVRNMTYTPVRSNFGVGCAGSHSVLLVDGWEGMRAKKNYEQAGLVAFDEPGKAVTADATPVYRERWPDARAVRRRSRLCHDRFWLIEDLAAFEHEHAVTARWYLRPWQVASERGVMIETAEGVRLHLLPLLGPDEKTVQTTMGYPDRLDGESLQVSFAQRGAQCRWLWLAWPEQTREVAEDLAEDWEAQVDGGDTTWRLPFTMPAFMLADVPVARRWWYRKTFRVPVDGPCWLRLPRGMREACLLIDGKDADLAPHRLRMDLLAPQIELPLRRAGEQVTVEVRTDCGISQYGAGDQGGNGFSGRPALMVPSRGEPVRAAAYRDGVVTVNDYRVEHALLEAP